MIKKFFKFLIYFIIIIFFCFNPHTQEDVGETLDLAFAGDIFIQRQFFQSYYDSSKKTFLFPQEIFEDIKEEIKKDFSFVVIDTPISESYAPSGYPLYNAPPEILDALKLAGFNVMITSGNHTLDKGERGVIDTINNIKKRNLLYVGSNLSKDDANKILVLEKNGIKLAVLAYTFSTNGINPPQGKSYLVNYINEERIKKDIQNIRKSVDFIIVYLHWGYNQYSEEVEKSQRDLAKKIIKSGADLIVGSHPHAVRPYEKIDDKWCFYSIGNFLTDQYGVEIPQVKFGLILNFSLLKLNGKTFIRDKKITPIFIQRTKSGGKYSYKILKADKINNLKNISTEDKAYLKKLEEMLILK
ncbi:MAG TPA: CapA family protein [Dictyoglomaceae bacterium]|nr:CapA family protein [Dictyoglomaceae bacterium]HOL39835.1 CapA family protein [Dictyoglomaceae bacterium]HPP16313.1 CapA family protein [Dictyoglomaceae bacterium]